MPSRFGTPGPKLSRTMSARRASSRAIFFPASDFRSIEMLRLLRLALRNTVPPPGPPRNGGHNRVSSPWPVASTLITSAPKSPRYCAHSGPARTLVKSTTFTPSNGFTSVSLARAVLPQKGGSLVIGLTIDTADVKRLGCARHRRIAPPQPPDVTTQARADRRAEVLGRARRPAAQADPRRHAGTRGGAADRARPRACRPAVARLGARGAAHPRSRRPGEHAARAARRLDRAPAGRRIARQVHQPVRARARHLADVGAADARGDRAVAGTRSRRRTAPAKSLRSWCA